MRSSSPRAALVAAITLTAGLSTALPALLGQESGPPAPVDEAGLVKEERYLLHLATDRPVLGGGSAANAEA